MSEPHAQEGRCRGNGQLTKEESSRQRDNVNSPDSRKNMDEWKLAFMSWKLTVKLRNDGEESRLDASQAACTSFCQ